jgi:toxin-antitoxin system PIN domain toxin
MPKSKICLLDVNVWVAFAWAGHVHHEIARTWFAGLESGGAAFCRVTQMGFLRLITNHHVMGSEAVSQPRAWTLYEDLARDERVTFAPEPAEVEAAWKHHTQGSFTGTNVGPMLTSRRWPQFRG